MRRRPLRTDHKNYTMESEGDNIENVRGEKKTTNVRVLQREIGEEGSESR